jgi:hypothetical protein
MKKKYYFVILLIFFGQNIFGQAYLDVPLISQQRKSWCWVASTQMVLKYFNSNTSITQCDILNKYQSVRNPISPQCSFTGNCVCDTSATPLCNYEISYNPQTDIFQKIFKEYGYKSEFQSENLLPWDTIKKQIDNCQPIIVLFSRRTILDTNSDSGQHCVVIDGYLEQDCNHFLLVKDPWEPCDSGCSYALNYDTTEGAISMNTTSSLWVYDIKPDNGKNACDVLVPRSTIPNIRDIMPCKDEPQPITIREYKYSPTVVMKKTLMDLYKCFPKTLPSLTNFGKIDNLLDSFRRFSLYVISSDKIVNENSYWKPFDNKPRYLYHSTSKNKFQAILQKQVRQVTQLLSCPINSIDGYWYVESFGSCAYLCPNNICLINTNISFFTSFILIPTFQIVLFPPSNYVFYRFRKNKRTYYYSLTDYKDLGMGANGFFEANKAYSAIDVLYRLHLKTKQLKH